MTYCDLEDMDFSYLEFIVIDAGQVHVIAVPEAKKSTHGHRIDGFPVVGLEVDRGPDGMWKLAPGSKPEVRVESPVWFDPALREVDEREGEDR